MLLFSDSFILLNKSLFLISDIFYSKLDTVMDYFKLSDGIFNDLVSTSGSVLGPGAVADGEPSATTASFSEWRMATAVSAKLSRNWNS